MSVRYPVAVDAEAALKAGERRAVPAREALEVAGGRPVGAAGGRPVECARELAGPASPTREAAEAAWPGLVAREGQPAVQPEDRFCELMEVLEPEARRGGPGEQGVVVGSRR